MRLQLLWHQGQFLGPSHLFPHAAHIDPTPALWVWPCAKGFAYMTSFNPPGNLERQIVLVTPQFMVEKKHGNGLKLVKDSGFKTLFVKIDPRGQSEGRKAASCLREGVCVGARVH